MKSVKGTIPIITAITAILGSIILGVSVNFISSSNGKYTPIVYGAIIALTIVGLGLIVLQFMGKWLTQRRSVSITVKTGDKEIVVQNISAKDAETLIELLKGLEEGHFSFADEKERQELNNNTSLDEPISSDPTFSETSDEETSIAQQVYIITFNNAPAVEASLYASELRAMLLDATPEISIQHGRSEHYSQDLGDALILMFRSPALVAVSATIESWLQKRSNVSLTIETPAHKIIAQNIGAANATHLADLFLSQ